MRIGFLGGAHTPTKPSRSSQLTQGNERKMYCSTQKEDVTLGARGTWRAIRPRQGSQPVRPNSPQPAIGYRSEFRAMDRVTGSRAFSTIHFPLGAFARGTRVGSNRWAVRGLSLSSSLSSTAPRSHAEPADVDCGGWWECELCEEDEDREGVDSLGGCAMHGLLLDSLPYLYAKCKGHQPGNSVYGRSRSSLVGCAEPGLSAQSVPKVHVLLRYY